MRQTFAISPRSPSPCCIAAGTARAGDVYVQTNLVSNGTVPNTVTDPNLQGAWGLSFSTTSPFWISDQAASFNGSGASTVYRVSDTYAPDQLRCAADRGSHEPGERSPEPRPDQWPDGPGQHDRAGDHHGSTGLPARRWPGPRSFSPISTARFRRGTGARSSTIEATVAGASFTGLAIGNCLDRCPSSTPPTRTAATSTSSIISGR